MSKKCTVYVLALFAGLCAATISFFASFFPYEVDSASYIEQARSFIARGVFEITPISIWEADVVSIPDPLFPPGYPLIIAISSLLLHRPVEVIAPFLSLAALILLPIVIVYSFHRVLRLLPALCIGILAALTPAAVRFGYFAYGDLISLVLAIYAVNRLLSAGNKPANWFWLGLLTGFAYLLRNANLGLLLTIGLYLFWNFIVEPENRKEKLSNGLIWLGANALLIVPWLIRNFFVFGKLQPYSMPPSTVSLGENSHDYLQAQLDTLLVFSNLDAFLAGTPWGIILLLILAALLMRQVITTWKSWQKIEQHTFFIAVVYVAIGAAMVITARTRYEWGVRIDARYTLPYSCFVFVALVIIFKNTTLKINTLYLGLGLAITLLITRTFELPKLYEYSQRDQIILGAAKQMRSDQDVICSNLNERFAVSNYAFVYRILRAAPVRYVWSPFRKKQFADKTLQDWVALGAKHGIVVSLFASRDDKESGLPLDQDRVMKLKASGWQVERNEKENLVLSHKAISP